MEKGKHIKEDIKGIFDALNLAIDDCTLDGNAEKVEYAKEISKELEYIFVNAIDVLDVKYN